MKRTIFTLQSATANADGACHASLAALFCLSDNTDPTHASNPVWPSLAQIQQFSHPFSSPASRLLVYFGVIRSYHIRW